jgi:cytoskeletal protein CcmA (bactofilin family)
MTPPPVPIAAENTYTNVGGTSRPIITEDVEIKGELSFSGELEFHGRFEGSIESEGSITIGQNAIIKGGISANSADIAGKMQGNVTTTGRVHLRPEAMIYGDIKASVVVVEEGATVDGRIITNTTEKAQPDFSNIFTRLQSRKRPASSGSTFGEE